MAIRVPAYTGSVQEQARPNARLDANFTPASQGAAIGQAISQEAEKAKKKADDIVLTDMQRRLGEFETDTLYNPETGALTRQGKDAFDVPKQVRDKYEKFKSDLSSELTNKEQRAAFEKLAVTREIQMNRTVQRHVSDQIQKYDDNITKGSIDTAANNAALNYNDPYRIRAELDTIKSTRLNWAKRHGVSPEMTEAAVKDDISKANVGIVANMLANQEDQLAEAYFKETVKNGGFTADDKATIQAKVESGALVGKSQRKADEIIAKKKDYKDQLSAAESITEPKLRDEVKRRVKLHQAEQIQATQFTQQKAKDDAWSQVVNDNVTDWKNITNWNDLDGADQKAISDYLIKKASGEDIQTDWEVYHDLSTMPPTELVDTNIERYRPKLSNAEYKQVLAWQRAYRDAQAKGDDSILNGPATLQQQINSSLAEQGIKNKKEMGLFRSKAYQLIDAEQQARGKKLNQGERQQIIDNLLVQGKRKDHILGFIDTSARAYEIQGPQGAKEFYIKDYKDVPKRDAQQIRESVIRVREKLAQQKAEKTGQKQPPVDRNVTEADIVRYYNQKLQNQFDATQRTAE